MTCRTGQRGAAARSGLRLLALLVGLYAGLATVPADGVPARLAVLAAAVALVVVATGRPACTGSRTGRAGLDVASALALGLTVLAAAGAALAPPTLS